MPEPVPPMDFRRAMNTDIRIDEDGLHYGEVRLMYTEDDGTQTELARRTVDGVDAARYDEIVIECAADSDRGLPEPVAPPAGFVWLVDPTGTTVQILEPAKETMLGLGYTEPPA